MPGAQLDPLVDIAITPALAVMPKADLHLHQEVLPRLQRIVASRQGRAPYPRRAWAREVMDIVPAGAG